MEMSLSPRKGTRHVRGGHVLRVAQEHPVPTGPRRPDHGGHRYVHSGARSLAIEVCDARTGEVLGWSYLEGKARGLFSGGVGSPAKGKFDPPELGWSIRRFEFPAPHQASGSEIIDVLTDIRHGHHPTTLVAFQIVVAERHVEWCDAVTDMWRLAAQKGATRSGAELVGVVRLASDEAQAATFSSLPGGLADAFQVGLVLSNPTIQRFEVPW